MMMMVVVMIMTMTINMVAMTIGDDPCNEKDHLVGVLHVVVVMLAARARFLKKKRSLNVDKQGKENNCQAYKNTKGHLI